jgi:hypothetical protein
MPQASAQISEITIDSQGRWHSCERSGLISWSRNCGADTFYAYIFVGTVVEANSDKNGETALKVTPEEVFLGDKPDELSFRTSQGDCLPAIHVGDKWLFYLYREAASTNLVVAYGHPSAPIAEAEKQLALLRHLEVMPASGVLKGNVQSSILEKDHSTTGFPVRDQTIIARSMDGKARYSASSNQDGSYEFTSLPVGAYNLTANTTKGLWAQEGSIDIKPHSCTAVDFLLRPDGAISGRITNADGTPAKYPQVEAISLERASAQYYFASSDEHGNFQIHGLGRGRYLVGIDMESSTQGSTTEHGLYYPGVKSRNSAVSIELGQNEHRSNIDFSLQAP